MCVTVPRDGQSKKMSVLTLKYAHQVTALWSQVLYAHAPTGPDLLARPLAHPSNAYPLP